MGNELICFTKVVITYIRTAITVTYAQLWSTVLAILGLARSCVLRFIKIKLFVSLLCVCAILPSKTIPEMTYTVSGGMLNPIYSLTLLDQHQAYKKSATTGFYPENWLSPECLWLCISMSVCVATVQCLSTRRSWTLFSSLVQRNCLKRVTMKMRFRLEQVIWAKLMRRATALAVPIRMLSWFNSIHFDAVHSWNLRRRHKLQKKTLKPLF